MFSNLRIPNNARGVGDTAQALFWILNNWHTILISDLEYGEHCQLPRKAIVTVGINFIYSLHGNYKALWKVFNLYSNLWLTNQIAVFSSLKLDILAHCVLCKIVRVLLYRDTAGQERFRTLTNAYFRGAAVSNNYYS